MQKYIFTFLSGIIMNICTFGQAPINMGSGGEMDTFFLRAFESSDRENKTLNADSDPNIEGSRFLSKDFVKGEIYAGDKRYSNVDLKYNIYDGVFHFRAGPQVLVLDPREQVKLVKLGKRVFVIRTFNYKTRTIKGYLEVLVEGRYSLLNKMNMTLRPPRPPKALDTEPTPAKYIRTSDAYFLEMPGGELRQIKNGKDVLAIFKNSALKDEAKDQKISIKKNDHLPALVQLLNEMNL